MPTPASAMWRMHNPGAIREGADMSSHIATVQSIYAALVCGDSQAILDHIADGCVWEYQHIIPDAPSIRRQRGRTTRELFAIVAEDLALTKFEIGAIVGSDRLVIALVTLEFVVKRTWRVIREVDEPHLWHFDDHGRVVKFRHAADTYRQHVAGKGRAVRILAEDVSGGT